MHIGIFMVISCLHRSPNNILIYTIMPHYVCLLAILPGILTYLQSLCFWTIPIWTVMTLTQSYFYLSYLTAVSKFKPHLPAQWAIGTEQKVPVERKRNFRDDLTNRKFYSKSKIPILLKNIITLNPVPCLIQWVSLDTKHNLAPSTNIWFINVHTLSPRPPVMLSIGTLRWPLQAQWPASRRL